MEDWSKVPVFGAHPDAGACVIRPSVYGLVSDGCGCLAIVRTTQGAYLLRNYLPVSAMDNAELKTEADLLIRKTGLAELLARYPAWFVGGSYSYDLMCWRDLDIYVLDRTHDLKQCFETGYEITKRLAARKSRFTNNLGNGGGEPDGLYWGIKLGDILQGAWKLDVWFLDLAGYDEHAAYSAGMRARLTPEDRSIILAIKEAYWRRPSYRDTITSDLIYRAVLDDGVRCADEFARFVGKMSQAQTAVH